MQTETPVAICPAAPWPGQLWPMCPTPNLDMTSFPLCTCHFKGPGPGGPVPRVGLGEAGQLRVGKLLAPRGLPESGLGWGGCNKGRQWPPSLPRAASGRAWLGGLWGPLLFPVLAAGLLASRSGAGSGLGHLTPPAGLALSGQRSCCC